MKKTGSWLCRLVRKGWLGSALIAATSVAGAAEDVWQTPTVGTPRSGSARASSPATAIVNGMIDVAMEDGSLSASERLAILRQAARLVSPGALAAIESRLAEVPAASAPSSVAASTGQEVGPDAGVPALLPTLTLPAVPAATPAATLAPPVPATPLVGEQPASELRFSSVAAPTSAAGKSCCANVCDEPGCGGLLDNVYLFAAADAWRSPLDGNHNNNFGGRIGFNLGVPLLKDCGVGAQFGMSYGVYDFHGRFDFAPESEPSSIEDQLFFTAGVFRRCNLCGPGLWNRVSAGVVYDYMITDNTSTCAAELDIGQFRGEVGYALDEYNEVGIAGSVSDGTQDDIFCFINHTTRALDQINVFWHHKWCKGADTRLYTGFAEELGDWLVGANGEIPLGSCWSVFSGFHHILPSTRGGDPGFRDEFWNVTAGIKFYPGGTAESRTVCGRRWMPLLPVADNGSFATDLGF